ncbi:8-amino-7-oxononanoate synthase [Vibrio sp. ZSDZ34]|uniref:8-amino-7-oxononanoate synthase n=1 Tax=Vibrio gelatinilyticus TaxID=2893468 RepID=A0A9X1W869_9VIBR|nr:8-amino-7-oxononanoate synthase [Vibrio gelatinilyticus]MCJ2375409.1 8-amino-7-oxononanoate synthase [Vibrio gelatinilyticus]
MTQAFKTRIEAALNARKDQALFRTVHAFDSVKQSQISIDGRSYINFSSNDYLGLASSDELKIAYQDSVTKYGIGSGASPLVTGHSTPHRSLESQLCEWLGYSRALLFGSGFSANQAVLFTLLEKGDLLLQDRLNHASLIEAGHLGPANMRRFKHNDMEDLSRYLNGSQNTLVATESVFSMDGDIAPIDALLEHCRASQSWSMIDDAHGIGVLGEDGRGARSLSEHRPDILVITFGKAFGLNGAAVLCGDDIADYLTQFARHYIYSTAMSPAHASALSKAASMIQTQHWRREKLFDLSEQLHNKVSDLHCLVETKTPIKPWLCGESNNAIDLSNALKEQGIWTTAIRPPTVPKNSARLRITLSAAHHESDIDTLSYSLMRSMEAL